MAIQVPCTKNVVPAHRCQVRYMSLSTRENEEACIGKEGEIRLLCQVELLPENEFPEAVIYIALYSIQE
jgi:hypothetical protein